MTPSLQQETEKLARSWMRHEQAELRNYLVADVEDPRLNVQSVMTRQFLITALCGDKFKRLMDEELRFAVAMNWLLDLTKRLSCAEEYASVLHALKHHADDAEGIEVPADIARTWASLPVDVDGVPVPNYIADFLGAASASQAASTVLGRVSGTMISLWQQVLSRESIPHPTPSVLEAACGSANDYRFLHDCGLGRLVDYTGFDLCEKNVANARAMFPQTRFEVGNVFALSAGDRSCDYLIAHDLFEHLSPEALEAAISETCRVVRRGMCLGFFKMEEIPEHVIRPVEDYHWNTLSVTRVKESFGRHGFDTQAVHIGSFVRWATGSRRTHNENAYTFLLQRRH